MKKPWQVQKKKSKPVSDDKKVALEGTFYANKTEAEVFKLLSSHKFELQHNYELTIFPTKKSRTDKILLFREHGMGEVKVTVSFFVTLKGYDYYINCKGHKHDASKLWRLEQNLLKQALYRTEELESSILLNITEDNWDDFVFSINRLLKNEIEHL